jgi:hypothetical protein
MNMNKTTNSKTNSKILGCESGVEMGSKNEKTRGQNLVLLSLETIKIKKIGLIMIYQLKTSVTLWICS